MAIEFSIHNVIECRAHLERLSGLPLLARFLDLGSAHLLLELSLANTAVILKREQDIKIGKLLQLVVVPVLVRLDDLRMRGSPASRHIDFEFLE